MSLFSLGFVGFVLGGLLLYYLLPKKAQWPVLLGLSWLFYILGGLGMFGYLLFVTLTTYGAGRILGCLAEQQKKLSKEEKATVLPVIKRKKKFWAGSCMVLNFALLFFVKYWDFVLENINAMLGLSFPLWGILAPLGISYYMFQSIGYLIDVYRGKVSAETNFFKYSLFVSFFPQITQGPIGRFDHLAPQLFGERDFSFDNCKAGLQLILWGALKKMVVADRAGVVVSQVYGNYQSYGGVVIAFGVLFYCIQLYCDFSGGIDIIRGIAKIFGIDMAENFRRPLFSTSLTDFWRRWHISLGTWMKDYLFYPVSLSKPLQKLGKFSRKKIGGRVGKVLPTSVVTFLIYFVIGIWHGSSWKYIAFGLYNGVFITAGILLEPMFSDWREKHHITPEHKGMYLFRLVRTWVLVFFGRYITRAGSFLTAVAMLWKTVRHPIPSQITNGVLLQLGLTPWDYAVVAIGTLVLVVVELFQERGKDLAKTLEEKPFVLQWAVMAAGLLVLLLFGIFRGDYIAAEFIYQQF